LFLTLLLFIWGNTTVNSIAWAPHELGAILACASSDGKISILEYKGKEAFSFVMTGKKEGCVCL
jgi:protein transport protein SEC13